MKMEMRDAKSGVWDSIDIFGEPIICETGRPDGALVVWRVIFTDGPPLTVCRQDGPTFPTFLLREHGAVDSGGLAGIGVGEGEGGVGGCDCLKIGPLGDGQSRGRLDDVSPSQTVDLELKLAVDKLGA